ncbi:hypothetical protein KDA_47570 [Dictyobacter alpinus]|uniref:Uncharacterized protein n=1 Tax=Dictyobacter alpinus TaxID=2014873 RepID=A0A402BD11_9CHLR|nr:hypothetical protein [Dictyobacter alpinus]GCE29273.1 hypothetical protein KDA_47570 [Dictyobacter alpinus]
MQAFGTLLLFGLMFSGPEPLGRQVNDLTFLDESGESTREIGVAVRTVLNPVNQNRIWCFDLAQCIALVSWLAST